MSDARVSVAPGVELEDDDLEILHEFPFGVGGATAWWTVDSAKVDAGDVMPNMLQNLVEYGFPLGRDYTKTIPVVEVQSDVTTDKHLAADMRNPSPGTGIRYGYDLASRPAAGTIALVFARHGAGWSVLEIFGYQVWMRAGEWRVTTAGQSTPGMDLAVTRVPLPPEGGLCVLAVAWEGDFVTLAVGAAGATDSQSGNWAVPTDPANRVRLRIPNGTSSTASVGMKFMAAAIWPGRIDAQTLRTNVIASAKKFFGIA